MKLSTIDAIAGILGGMKLNRIGDKSVKAALVNDYLHLRRFVKKAHEEADEFREKFREDWSDEMAVVELLRKSGVPLDEHDAYMKAEKDANETLKAMFDEDVEVSIKAVPVVSVSEDARNNWRWFVETD